MALVYRQSYMGGADPWAAIDGRASAPVGPSQYPNLLNGYPTATPPNTRVRWPTLIGTQPQWNVAGVDYAVGVPSNINLQDPNTIVSNVTIPGVTVTRSNVNGGSSSIGNYLSVTGNNIVIDSWDFSLHGGWQVDVTGNNCSIQNCNFKQLSTALTPIHFELGATGGLVQYNNIDGNSTNDISGFATAQILIFETAIVRYNYIHDCWGHPIDIGGASDTVTFNCKYNLIANIGISAAQHGDLLFANTNVGGASGTIFNSFVFYFNTFYQPNAPTGGGSQGVTIFGHVSAIPTFNNPSISYNTMITLSPSPPLAGTGNAGVSPLIQMAAKEINGVGSFINNYVDPSGNQDANGVAGHFIDDRSDLAGSLNGTASVSGNVNMTNGHGTVLSGNSWTIF